MAEYRSKNKETLIKYSAEYRTKNKEVIAVKQAKYRVEYCAKNKEAINAQNAKYRAKNKEAIKERDSKYRVKNKETIMKWRSKNKDKLITYYRNRRSKKRLATGSHTSKDILMLRELQRYRCAICKCSVKKKYHVDHIYPLSSGGSNGKENLQILCPACNLGKSAKDPIQFMNQNGLLL